MSNKSETKRIFLQMSEVTNKIVISLGESISICNKRKNLYFQHYVKEILNISPDLENRHNEVLRDHKIGYRRFSLIKKKIDDATSKEITHYLVNQIKNDISDAWKFILQTGEKDQNITEELKFIEEHIKNKCDFIKQSGVDFDDNFEISEYIDEDEDFFDVRENNDYPF